MSRPVVHQRRLYYRGRMFHFVSYDGSPADRKHAATMPAWWLMSGGTRWEVMPFHPGGDEAELERAFTAWLDAHAFQGVDQQSGG